MDFSTSAQAFATLSSETSKEADAHNVVAQALQNEIAMPLKNLAESQTKERRSVSLNQRNSIRFFSSKLEDILNRKFKEWNGQKEKDIKVERSYLLIGYFL